MDEDEDEDVACSINYCSANNALDNARLQWRPLILHTDCRKKCLRNTQNYGNHREWKWEWIVEGEAEEWAVQLPLSSAISASLRCQIETAARAHCAAVWDHNGNSRNVHYARTNGSWHSVPAYDNTRRAAWGERRRSSGVAAGVGRRSSLLSQGPPVAVPLFWPCALANKMHSAGMQNKNDKKRWWKAARPSPLRTRLSRRSASKGSHSAPALSMPLAEAPLAVSTCAQRSRTHTHTPMHTRTPGGVWHGKTVDSAAIFIVATVWQRGGGIGCCSPYPGPG